MSMRKIISGVVITPTLAAGSYYGYQAFSPNYVYEYAVTIDGNEYVFKSASEAEEYKVTHEINNIELLKLTEASWKSGTYDKNLNDEVNNYSSTLKSWLQNNPHKTRGGNLASANADTQELGAMGERLLKNYSVKNEETGEFTNTRLRSVINEANSINDLLFSNKVNLFELDTKAKLDNYVELMIKGAAIDANLNPTELTLWCGPAKWGPITVNMLTEESLYRFDEAFSLVFNQLFQGNKARSIDLETVFNMTKCTPNTIASNSEGSPIENIDEVVTYIQSLYVEADFNKFVFNEEQDYIDSTNFEDDFSVWKALHGQLYSYQAVIYKTLNEAEVVATEYAKENHVVIEKRKVA